MNYRIEPYQLKYIEQCLALFDCNCPTYFAFNERDDYRQFLQTRPPHYHLYFQDDSLVAAYGLMIDCHAQCSRIQWIMVRADMAGSGVGRMMMNTAVDVSICNQLTRIEIAASQHSAPFFERFSAKQIDYVENGWGPDMHKIDMVISL